MAISVSNLISNGVGAVSVTSQDTASISPSANKLILATITSRLGTSVEPNTPTLTGNGLTWVAIDNSYWDTSGSSRRKTTLFRAMGSSPSAGAVTIDFAGQTQTDVLWNFDEVTGMDTSGTNGSGAIVQSAKNNSAGSTVSSLTITLGAFSSANNGTYGAFGGDTQGGNTAGSGFTITGTGFVFAGSNFASAEFKATNDTSVDYTVTSSALGGIAIEIKEAVFSPTNIGSTFLMMGV